MSARTILIGFDAMDRRRLQRLMADGRIPNISRLASDGIFAAMEPQPRGFHSMPWPSFIRGESSIDHGWYAAKRWNPEAMRLEAKPPEWLEPTAFWEKLAEAGHRIALLDVPFSPPPGEDFNGICLHGWQNHDQIEHYSFPSDLWGDFRTRFGEPIMKRELCTSQSVSELVGTRADVLEANQQFARICSHGLRREDWDLCIAVFGAPHRIGHYLWDTSQVSDADPDPELVALVDSAVDEVYCDCDRILGDLLREVDSNSTVAAFSLHGMRKDGGWCAVLPHLLPRIGSIGAPDTESSGILYRVKQKIPSRLVERLIWHLPYSISETIVPLWSRRMYDWPNVRSFALPGGDGNGFVRINLKGREARGTVENGLEYRELCARIAAGLESFRLVETGKPVVERIDHISDHLDDSRILTSRVPDLVVHWTSSPAYAGRGVVSREHGEILWEPGWQTRSGRSGDHSPRGWLAARGPGVAMDKNEWVLDIADMGSTVLTWMADQSTPRDNSKS